MTKVKTRKPKVFWTASEEESVISKALDVMATRPGISLGVALQTAQKIVLPEDRRKTAGTLYGVKAEQYYGKKVELEIKRREKVAKKAKELPIILPGLSKATLRKPMVVGPEIHDSPMDTVVQMVNRPEQFRQEEESVAQSMGGLVTRLIRSVGDAYEEALYEELRARGQRAVMRAARDEASAMKFTGLRSMQSAEVPPVPAPAPMPASTEPVTSLRLENHAKAPTHKVPMLHGDKPKIALVGDPKEDWKYFDRIKHGLEEKLEFVMITKLKDTPKVSDCQMIIISGSADHRVVNAARNIGVNVSYIFNKPGSVVNQVLADQCRTREATQRLSKMV